MTKDDVIRMAREAGFVVDEKSRQHQPNCIFHTNHMVDELLERFAALVAEAEREACAKVCDSMPYRAASAGKAADAIRARGEQK